jgi:hypothetical protein
VFLLISALLSGCGDQPPSPTSVEIDSHLPESPTKTSTSKVNPLTISIPSGQSPVIDGTISPNEWNNAVIERFSDNSELLLLQSEGYLFVGIRANTPDMIAGNIFIHRNEEVAILHVSAALGTAIYHQEPDFWQQTRGFDWCCQDSSLSELTQAERDAFFQKEGWGSVNSWMGTPNELEYQIEVGSEPLRLAVNYIKTSDPNEKIPWPSNLDDDCIKPTPGGLPAQLNFSPDQWVKLNLSSK